MEKLSRAARTVGLAAASAVLGATLAVSAKAKDMESSTQEDG
jgi:hypothetical protein